MISPPGQSIWRLRSSVAALGLLVTVGCNALSGADAFEVGGSSDPSEADLHAGVLEDEEAGAPTLAVDRDAGERTETHPGDDASSPSPEAGVDSGPPPPPLPKRVFVTTDMFTGNLGGRAGGDSKCAAAAAAGGLSGEWIAWLSVTNGKAIDRITHTGAYVLLNGNQVVANKAQLTSGSISHAIDVTEKNVALTANKGVWTGTRADGAVDATCSDWTSSASGTLGTLASAVATDIGWTKGAPQSGLPDNWRCNTSVSLYCFEQ